MGVTEAALDELMAIAGRLHPDFVSIEAAAPLLKTRFYADEAAAASLAAGGVIAADLWRQRGGRAQGVRVATREAGLNLVGFMHQKFADASRAPPMHDVGRARAAASGFKRTRDNRHIYLHPSFPESTKRLLSVLACPEEADAVAEATAKWNAQDLEDAIAAAGACAAIARTPEEWDESEQGRSLAARPVVEVIRFADSPPEPLPANGEAPLSGVRVLDLTRVLAGPTCARTLAQYGADVLYIASPNLPSVPFFVSDTNHGKLSAFVDLKLDAERERLRALVREGDVFSQGYRSGALERLGFGPLELARIRPGLIYTSINCYGHEGPWWGRPGWEQLGQTATGMAHLHGGEDGPRLQPGAVTDYTTGFLAAFGSLLALQRRALYGGSYLVRVSLSQTAMWLRRLGLSDDARLDRAEPHSPEEIAAWSITSETGYGTMTYLRPAVTLSETPTRWRRPTTPLGSHDAAWPAR